jgi:hypothetical protein
VLDKSPAAVGTPGLLPDEHADGQGNAAEHGDVLDRGRPVELLNFIPR